jgi:hypothetical protein
MKPVFRCLSLLVLWGLAHPLLAALPQTLNYQGRMRTSGGAPVPDSPGNTVVFRICADPSCTGGGDPLWTETWNSGTSTVDTKSGLFNVVLGTHNPITLPFDQQYYLEINFNSDGPMTPRQPLESVAAIIFQLLCSFSAISPKNEPTLPKP